MSASAKAASRRKARELALQVLYAVDQSESARARKAGAGEGAGEDATSRAVAQPPAGARDEAASPPERARRRLGLPERAPRPARSLQHGPSEPASPEQTFEAVAEHFEMAAGARDFARELALGAHAREAELDELIGAHARNWRVDRMAVVDRNILRLGAFELRFTDTPTPVVVDEAVGLARRFGDDPSPAFVNGILDAIAKGVRPSAS